MDYRDVSELKGRVIKQINVVDDPWEDEAIIFRMEDGEVYKMFHIDDCCESVTINDICGDLDDLIGSPILMAEEVTESGDNEDFESFTWTFYKFATAKGYVTIRWLGESNGYYSEEVDFVAVKEETGDVGQG